MSLPHALSSFSQESEETCEEKLREILRPKVQCQLAYSEAIWLRAGAQQKRTLNKYVDHTENERANMSSIFPRTF